jgi:hypothetical protein
VILAAGTTDPFGSITVAEMLPVTVCPKATGLAMITVNTINASMGTVRSFLR